MKKLVSFRMSPLESANIDLLVDALVRRENNSGSAWMARYVNRTSAVRVAVERLLSALASEEKMLKPKKRK